MPELAVLRHKYDPVVRLMHARGAQVRTIEMQGAKLLLRAEAPSADVKNAICATHSFGPGDGFAVGFRIVKDVP